MHDDIELFADASVCLFMMALTTSLFQIDPVLAIMWTMVTAIMSWPR